MQSSLVVPIQRLLIMLGVLLASGGVRAADYTWAGNASHTQWNIAHAIWWNGSTGVVWPNLSTDNAVFSSSSSQKTVSAVNGILVGNMTFTADGYLLTGGTIWPGATITVSTGHADQSRKRHARPRADGWQQFHLHPQRRRWNADPFRGHHHGTFGRNRCGDEKLRHSQGHGRHP